MATKGNNNELPAAENNITSDIDVYSADFIKSSEEKIKLIKKELSNTEKGFVKIAIALKWLKVNQAYRTYGMKNITELAESKFGFKSTKTYDYLNIIDRFGNGDNENIATDLKKEFKAYTPSKLVNLLPLTNDEILLNTNPDMSVREIKDRVKAVLKHVDKQLTLQDVAEHKESETVVTDNTDTREQEEPAKTGIIKEWVSDTVYDFMEAETIEEFEQNLADLKAHAGVVLDVYKRRGQKGRIITYLQHEEQKEIIY